MTRVIRGAAWLGFYLFLVVFPLIIGSLAGSATGGQQFWLEVSMACGYVGLAIVASEFALVSRIQSVAGAFSQDALQQFHKKMSYVAMGFLLAHPMLLFLNGFPWTLLNPFAAENGWASRWGAISFFGVLVVILISKFRNRWRIPDEWWHVTRAGASLVIVLFALFHMYMIGNYFSSMAMKALWSCYIFALLAIAIQYRIIRPISLWSKPWEVVANVEEYGNARTLVLRPVGHPGLTFEPGQFAWLNMGKTPFHFEQHPVSFSSSAEIGPGGSIAFTIRALGDWSCRVVPAIKPGTRMWVDGPYRVFSADREQGPSYVLIGGGTGITPLHSICDTLAARGDKRPVLLIYCSRDYDDLTFRDELEQLSYDMSLTVVYVLDDPNGWPAEKGRLTAEMLRRRLPRQYKRFQYFVCGPTPLMNAMERLLPDIGVPREVVHTERFDMV
jgi:predicted ferric reductase